MSTNGGSSWSQYPESLFNNCDLIGDGTAPCPADDVVIDPSNPKNVYVAIDGENVYYSNNGGLTFTGAALTGSVGQGRDSLAVGPPEGPPLGPSNAPGVVYAMVGAADGAEYIDLFVSFTGGSSWDPATILTPTVPQFAANGITIDGSNPSNFSQSFYDQAMVVSPTNPGAVWFGGVGLYGSSGFGHYDAERKPMQSADADAIIQQARLAAGFTPRTISSDEIVERIIYALVNEGARILEEGYALRAVDIDIIYLNGYGFPAYRGGPMWYADTVGLKKVYERILDFERQHGKLWTPAPLLKQLAKEGRTFADFDKKVAASAA